MDQGNHCLCILYVLKAHDKTTVITFRYILMQFDNDMGLMFSNNTFIHVVQKNCLFVM